MAQLDGKIAIVTGGARGIGAAAAKALCEAGAVAVITDLHEAYGAARAEELAQAGHQTMFIRHDVRDQAGWRDVVDRTLERFGRIDCLVNNAGMMIPRNVETASAEEFRAAIEVNVIGNLFGMQAVIPAMKAAGGGSIINIASDVTAHVMSAAAVYAPSKAAQASLSRCAAVHCAEGGYNIRVNSIHPGAQATEFLMGGSENKETPGQAYLDAYTATIPMHRMGQPSEVASVVVFLASDGPAYMTGSEIFIDGGISAA